MGEHQKDMFGGDDVSTMPLFSETAPRVKEEIFDKNKKPPPKQLSWACAICAGTGKYVTNVRMGRRIIPREVRCPCPLGQVDETEVNDEENMEELSFEENEVD